MKKRLDIVIAERGLCKSRSAATELIKREGVMINGVLIKKPSTKVDEYEQFDITPLQFVSRGGLKLEHALTQFDIDVSGKTAIDIGSSTGGFTDCLLQRGIEKVIAIDVGTNQLDQSIKDDPRVELHEKTDIRTFKLKKKVDIAVIDVSFISIL
jgi:23S rRNA (cytidine1920-2'-O)/16S rRNA (cytidine1409-2'-O)-methyltransferase